MNLTPGRALHSRLVGVFLFLPLLTRLGFDRLVAAAGYPGSEMVPATSALLALLTLKLLDKERRSHIDDFNCDEALGLFAGLNVLPKKSFATDYSYRVVRDQQLGLLQGWVKALAPVMFPEPEGFSLDFHPIPYRGDPAGLDRHYLPRRGKAGPSVLTFFALEQTSRCLCYANANLTRATQDGELMRFVEFWHEVAETVRSAAEQVVAIVTGAGRGIGAAIAERLGADGMAVACLDIDEAVRAGDRRPAGRAGRDRRRVRRRRQRRGRRRAGGRPRSPTELGAPTVLVNNAGVLRDNLLFKMSGDDWDTVMQVHLRGTFLMTRAAQRHMTAASYGRIVNLSSTSALGNRGQAQLLRGQGRPAGLHQDRRPRARQVRRHLQRGRARLHRHRDDPGDRRARRPVLRGVQRRPRRGHPGQPRRPARGRRRRGLVLLLARGRGFVSGQVLYVAGGPRT